MDGKDLPWSVEHVLLCRQDSVANQLSNYVTGHACFFRGLDHGEPRAILDRRLVARNALRAAIAADSPRVPSMTKRRDGAHPIERGGDVVVRPTRAHLSNHLVDFNGVAHRVFAWSRLANAKLRMLSAPPVNHEYNFATRVVNVDHHL